VGVRRSSNGRDLAGAAAEVRWLQEHFEDVQSYVDEVPPLSAGGGLAGHQVLHFASHIEASGARPWNSAIHLGDSRGTAQTLTAAEVVDARLSARLCVLSGCESAGGRVLGGEGAQSLAAAFLAAGVPVVVATAWPVDDRATQLLMQAFYAQLGDGATVAQALRSAQRVLAGHAATADPFYWSGIVLIGDGSIRVPLRTRPQVTWRGTISGAPRALLVGALLALLAGAAALVLRRAAMSRAGARSGPAGGAVESR
jgi:hypothetical protein